MDNFVKFKLELQKHFDEMQKEATHLFEVNVDKDELWNTYMDWNNTNIEFIRCKNWLDLNNQICLIERF